MSKLLYRSGRFIIFQCSKGFIVQNTHKRFEVGHTHLNNFNAGKRAIWYVKNSKIPRKCSIYYLQSLKRLTSDGAFAMEIESLIQRRIQNSKNSKNNKNFSNS